MGFQGFLILSAVLLYLGSCDPNFALMADQFVPTEFNKIPPLLSSISDSVVPGDVYPIRKQLLLARDMLDVFSPVYKNNVNGVDLWGLLRKNLDDGYTWVGDFQDLDHSHVNYTQTELAKRRGVVLLWKVGFVNLTSQYDVPTYLRTAQLGTSPHKSESGFYWKGVTQRPYGTNPGAATVQYLVHTQLQTALNYFDSVFPVDSVLNDSIHEIFHDLRKNLRTVMDETKEFGTTLLPNSAPVLETYGILSMARDKAGNINDEITAYNFDEQHGKTNGLPAQAAKINSDWASMKTWMTQVSLRQKLVNLMAMLPAHLLVIE